MISSFPYTLCGQTNDFSSLKAQELALLDLYEKSIQCMGSMECDVNFLDQQLAIKMSEMIKNNKKTFDYDFDKLKKAGLLEIYSSDDHQLKIYSWHKMPYTSMVSTYTIFQYKTGAKIYTSFEKDSNLNIKDAVSKIEHIHTFNSGQKTYYFLIKNSILSSNEFVQSIEITELRNNTFHRKIPLFKTKTKVFGSIDFTFLRSSINDARNPYQLIQIDSNSKSIRIPVVDEQLQVKKSYLKYVWNGHYFKYVGIEK